MSTHASTERGLEKDPTNFSSVEQCESCLCTIVMTTSLIAFCSRWMWLLILGILWYLGVLRYLGFTGLFTIFFIACLPFWHHFKLSYNMHVIHACTSPFHKVQIRSGATVKRTTEGYSSWVHSLAPNLCSANYLNLFYNRAFYDLLLIVIDYNQRLIRQCKIKSQLPRGL